MIFQHSLGDIETYCALVNVTKLQTAIKKICGMYLSYKFLLCFLQRRVFYVWWIFFAKKWVFESYCWHVWGFLVRCLKFNVYYRQHGLCSCGLFIKSVLTKHIAYQIWIVLSCFPTISNLYMSIFDGHGVILHLQRTTFPSILWIVFVTINHFIYCFEINFLSGSLGSSCSNQG